MKYFTILLFIIIDVAFAGNEDVTVVNQLQNINIDGSYAYAYDLSNGQSAAEAGIGGVKAEGTYTYVAPDGSKFSVNYISDENGYQPQGDHLPQAPPVPEAILRALEYIRTHPPKEPVH